MDPQHGKEKESLGTGFGRGVNYLALNLGRFEAKEKTLRRVFWAHG